MDADTYYNTLTDSQKAALKEAINHAEAIGVDVAIIDAIDIWYLLPADNRGPKPDNDSDASYNWLAHCWFTS